MYSLSIRLASFLPGKSCRIMRAKNLAQLSIRFASLTCTRIRFDKPSFSMGVATYSVFEDVVVHLVHVFVKEVRSIIVVGISVCHCLLPVSQIAAGFKVEGGDIVEFFSDFLLKSIVCQTQKRFENKVFRHLRRVIQNFSIVF